MKTHLPFVLLIVGLVALFGLVMSSLAAPLLDPPFTPFGTVKLNGENVPLDTPIEAFCDNVRYGSDLTIFYLGDSYYRNMNIPKDDPGTSAKDG